MDEESDNAPQRQEQWYPGLQRLLVAAATDPELAALIVNNPQRLVSQERERFPLSDDELALLLSIAGKDIYDISDQVYKHIQQLSAQTWCQEHTLSGEDDLPEAELDSTELPAPEQPGSQDHSRQVGR